LPRRVTQVWVRLPSSTDRRKECVMSCLVSARPRTIDPATSSSFLARRHRIALPYILQRLGKRLLFHCPVHVSGVARKYELVVIAFGREYLRHLLVGEHPVVHVVTHHVRIEQIPVPNFHPDSYRL